jgi:hypothetical protein
MGKVAIVAYLWYYPSIFLEELRKRTKILRTPELGGKIKTRDLSNKMQEY